jgi:hypothetical protein
VSLHLLHGRLLILERSKRHVCSRQGVVACRRGAWHLLEQARSS